jgi:hypothetical protein
MNTEKVKFAMKVMKADYRGVACWRRLSKRLTATLTDRFKLRTPVPPMGI